MSGAMHSHLSLSKRALMYLFNPLQVPLATALGFSE